MKNLLVAFLLFAFVGAGYVANASSSVITELVKGGDDKKDKKACDTKKSCCKAKGSEAKACAGMTKDGEAKATAPSATGEASASATDAPTMAPAEKKACCKKKSSCSGETKDKGEKGATL